RTLVLEPSSRPNLESWSCSSLALPLRAFSTSSRSVKSASTDIEERFVLAIFYLPRNGQHSSIRGAANKLIHSIPLQVNGCRPCVCRNSRASDCGGNGSRFPSHWLGCLGSAHWHVRGNHR